MWSKQAARRGSKKWINVDIPSLIEMPRAMKVMIIVRRREKAE
jgi:hypothetical protein